MAQVDLSDNSQVLSAENVTKIHQNADTDLQRESIHHTLGPRPTQAAPGDHNHDGSNSVQLLAGQTIVGPRSNSSAILPSIIAALVRLGAVDNSTA